MFGGALGGSCRAQFPTRLRRPPGRLWRRSLGVQFKALCSFCNSARRGRHSCFESGLVTPGSATLVLHPRTGVTNPTRSSQRAVRIMIGTEPEEPDPCKCARNSPQKANRAPETRSILAHERLRGRPVDTTVVPFRCGLRMRLWQRLASRRGAGCVCGCTCGTDCRSTRPRCSSSADSRSTSPRCSATVSRNLAMLLKHGAP